jgi:hypothetical protein
LILAIAGREQNRDLRKDDHMKHAKFMAVATLLLMGVGVATAQSLGDYARAVRKNKPEPSAASRHYDNDNLPTEETLSVVGPPPGDAAGQAPKTAADPNAAAADRQKTADAWKQKLDAQKEKIASLSHELDLEQREYRLRAAAFYADAGVRLRDSAQFDKDGAQYKSDVDEKQKAIDAAKQELDQLQEEARKAGMEEKEKDSAPDKAQDKSQDKSKE